MASSPFDLRNTGPNTPVNTNRDFKPSHYPTIRPIGALIFPAARFRGLAWRFGFCRVAGEAGGWRSRRVWIGATCIFPMVGSSPASWARTVLSGVAPDRVLDVDPVAAGSAGRGSCAGARDALHPYPAPSRRVPSPRATAGRRSPRTAPTAPWPSLPRSALRVTCCVFSPYPVAGLQPERHPDLRAECNQRPTRPRQSPRAPSATGRRPASRNSSWRSVCAGMNAVPFSPTTRCTLSI